MKNQQFFRMHILSITMFLFAILLVSRLFYLQIINWKGFADDAERQYVTSAEDIFDRGNIYFKEKDGNIVNAATTMSGFKIAISPKDITDKEDLYNKLSAIVPIDKEDFLQKANKKDDPYEEVAVRVLKEEADQALALKEKGVIVPRDKWRFYPSNNIGAQTIGFVGFKGKEFSGRYGLERYYNDVLIRREKDLYVNFFAEVFSNIRNSIFNNENEEGHIVTNIEPSVEDFLVKKVNEISKKWNSDGTGAIIINPKDGSIYAMAYSPDFDLNNYNKEKDVKVFSNLLIENPYEFGSVIKPLVMAAGIDTGVVNKDTTYTDNGFVTVEGKRINNFDHIGRGANVTMQEVLNQSLNTGMVFVEKKLGRDNFRNYMYAYELDKKTNIDLPNEGASLVSALSVKNREIEYANMSFGQGIAFTPIQVVKAFSSLANGGYLVDPHIINKIKYESGIEKVMEYEKGAQVLKPQTSEEITKMLVNIVDNALEHGKYKMEHYSIAAKTGTAQIALPGGGGYYDDRHLHSFFGYFPAYNPEFLMLFFTANPKNAQYAANTLPAPFMETVKFLLSYYEVPPDR